MSTRLQLGFDNYSLRSLKWSARQLIDYAARLRLDALMFSDLEVFESLNEDHLLELKRRADDAGLSLYVGMLSICPSSVIFDLRRGSAVESLQRTVRVAQLLGSPIARCVLGKIDDRRSPGGIQARVEETLKVLQACRTAAVDAGVKIAVENHAGDLQSRELLALIETAGLDFLAVTMDAGNAPWAMEDPLQSLELLGPHALCTGIRDSAPWLTPDGAAFQWTAMGEGTVDWQRYFQRFGELCPATPVILETISARHFDLPYRRDSFWADYSQRSPREFSDFLSWAQTGTPRPLPMPDLALSPTFQQSELEKSLAYCRETLGLGRKQ